MEETVARKGDICGLTLSLLHGTLHDAGGPNHSLAVEKYAGQEIDASVPEEIMLFDEVDVFFGSEFYGSK